MIFLGYNIVMGFLVFKKIHPQPATGFQYTDPDTGYRFTGHNNLKELLTAVEKYRENNNLEKIADLYYAVCEHICKLPANRKSGCCKEVEKLNDISYSQFLSGGKYLLKSKIKKMFGFKNETEEFTKIAARRKQCTACPFNVLLDESAEGHAVRMDIKSMMKSEFPEVVTPHDEEIGVCGVCNCPVEYKSCLSDKDIAESVRAQPMAERDRFPDGRKNVKTDLDADGLPFICFQKAAYDRFFTKKGKKVT